MGIFLQDWRLESPAMRPRTLPPPAVALPACETVVKPTTAVHTGRRPHAVHEVVTGTRLPPGSDTRGDLDHRVGCSIRELSPRIWTV